MSHLFEKLKTVYTRYFAYYNSTLFPLFDYLKSPVNLYKKF